MEAEARAAARAERKDPDAPPPDRALRNFTDPGVDDSGDGDGFVQGDNAQVVVAEAK